MAHTRTHMPYGLFNPAAEVTSYFSEIDIWRNMAPVSVRGDDILVSIQTTSAGLEIIEGHTVGSL